MAIGGLVERMMSLGGRIVRDDRNRATFEKKPTQTIAVVGGVGAVVFVPADLRLHATAAGLPNEEIPVDILPEERLLSVAAHVAAELVKICAPALEKARNSPFAGALPEECTKMMQTAAMQRVEQIVRYGQRPTVSAPRAAF